MRTLVNTHSPVPTVYFVGFSCLYSIDPSTLLDIEHVATCWSGWLHDFTQRDQNVLFRVRSYINDLTF